MELSHVNEIFLVSDVTVSQIWRLSAILDWTVSRMVMSITSRVKVVLIFLIALIIFSHCTVILIIMRVIVFHRQFRLQVNNVNVVVKTFSNRIKPPTKIW